MFQPRTLSRNLKELNLENNQIKTIKDLRFKSLNNNASQSKPTSSKEKFVYECDLKVFKMPSNLLQEFPFRPLYALTSLKSLDLSRNQITDFTYPPEREEQTRVYYRQFFHSMKLLQEIELSSNLLKKFPVELAECPKLQRLWLVHN